MEHFGPFAARMIRSAPARRNRFQGEDMQTVTIVGAGLAGCEAAWQLARRGVAVQLFEMKPHRFSPAHTSENLAELVCSNSLRASRVDSAVGLLKEEMRRLGSLFMAAADATAVPAGAALAVDRERFSAYMTEKIATHPCIRLVREECTSLASADPAHPLILAAGPLATDELTSALARLSGTEHLAFYDAIAPIVSAASLDMELLYRKSRWDDAGPGDYLNSPMNREQYEGFLAALLSADRVAARPFEEARYFEGCLPLEVMAERGPDTLRFGPLKPVGLAHPVTGERFYAVAQLRAENARASAYNLVGFQTRLTYPEQQRVFRLLPGLERAEFQRLGSIHRNTFLCAPAVLGKDLALKAAPGVLVAGQLAGVEGYVESAACGLLAGVFAAQKVRGLPYSPPPAATAHAALLRHLTESDPRQFQPTNIIFALFPELETEGKRKPAKKERAALRAGAALAALDTWQEKMTAAS